ncbi:hypothetical protein OCF62_07490 [Bacillus wiedmannii]|uniref:hypothetical protein n=1 Tax=Bacillus wiedmannii TaxID=1890302 RepID=UPI0021D08ECD|nr:hypothetical protein [Bacillus wiedmannii]MCU5514413.1 hypothetical protein [Bacillus wiedmannii]
MSIISGAIKFDKNGISVCKDGKDTVIISHSKDGGTTCHGVLAEAIAKYLTEKTIKCKKCGHFNTENDVEQTASTSCGASCGCIGYEYELICGNCGNEIYSGREWGEFDRTEVFDDIIGELVEPNKTNEHNERK